MSYGFKHIKAQYNYHPDWTRPGGPGEVRALDSKRPKVTTKPGKPKSGGRRPRGSTR